MTRESAFERAVDEDGFMTEKELPPLQEDNPMRPKCFWLVRTEDVTGISGTGIVAYGVMFADGRVVTCWNAVISQIAIWRSIQEVEAVHGHNGKTRVEWFDG